MCFINKALATSRITDLKGDAWRLRGCGMFQMGDNEDMNRNSGGRDRDKEMDLTLGKV